MPVKRVIELEDSSPDIAQGTSLPASLKTKKKKQLPTARLTTNTPDKQEDYKSLEQNQLTVPIPEVTGRTLSDLVVAFINRPEFIAVMLTFLSFYIFVNKLQQLADFWLPLLTSGILNGVWFGISSIRSYRKKLI